MITYALSALRPQSGLESKLPLALMMFYHPKKQAGSGGNEELYRVIKPEINLDSQNRPQRRNMRQQKMR